MKLARLGLILALALGGLSAPLAVEAQPARRPYRIGVLHRGYFPNNPSVQGLRVGLKAMGLEEARDVTFEIRFTRGDPQATPHAAAAVAKGGVDLIFVDDEEAVRAVMAVTRAIPIVFIQVGDPVAAGIVEQVARPGGNATGVSNLATELVPKRLEMLKQMLPALRRVWAVYHPDDRSSLSAARKAQEVASRLKLELVLRPAHTREELVGHLKLLRAGDGVLSPGSRTLNIPGIVLDLVVMSRVPAVFDSAFWVQAGGLVSYGSEESTDAIQAARLVAKILQGAKPGDLPVEGSNKIELAINLKTAKSLGVRIPRELLARADHIIQ